MKYLVCGGAGYIGSHMAKSLAEAGHEVVVLDNLSTGHREAVKWGKLIEADIRNKDSLSTALNGEVFDGVIHMCARSLVGESMKQPFEYYMNNVQGTLNVLDWMRINGIKKLVFSSTAAVFGNPREAYIDENHITEPINPYGRSKLMVEEILKDAAHAYGLRSVSLRYFNACGADPSGLIGESHQPETHLIPNLLKSILCTSMPLKIFGDDYPTEDGTCIRDYVHVNDLASAHLLALKFLDENEGAHRYNLGNGNGFSVKQIIAAAERVTLKKIQYEVAPRRSGDPATLVACSVRAQHQLGWKPSYTKIDDIIKTAWDWHKSASY